METNLGRSPGSWHLFSLGQVPVLLCCSAISSPANMLGKEMEVRRNSSVIRMLLFAPNHCRPSNFEPRHFSDWNCKLRKFNLLSAALRRPKWMNSRHNMFAHITDISFELSNPKQTVIWSRNDLTNATLYVCAQHPASIQKVNLTEQHKL